MIQPFLNDSDFFKSVGIDEGGNLMKSKKMPIGTVSKGYKKVAEGKWVPVKNEKKDSKVNGEILKPEQRMEGLSKIKDLKDLKESSNAILKDLDKEGFERVDILRFLVSTAMRTPTGGRYDRMRGLVNENDYDKFSKAVNGIFADLVEDGFESNDIYQFIYRKIK